MSARHALVMLPASVVACLAGGCASTDPNPGSRDPSPVVRVENPPVKANPFAPPATRREPTSETLFGEVVADPYRWLEAGDAPEVKAWAAAQDAFSEPLLDGVPGHDALIQRFTELFYIDSVSAPYTRGTRSFWTRRFKDKEKSIVYWREGKGPEQVLIDPNQWSADGTVALGGWYPSWDGRYVAYKLKQNNADEASLKVMEVATGKDLADHIEGAKYAGAAWTADAKGFYYVWIPPVGGAVTVDTRPGFAEVRWHQLGTDAKNDPQIMPSTASAKTFLDIDVSRDGHWMFLTIQHGWNQTDVWFRDLRKTYKLDMTPAPAELDTAARVAWHAERRAFKKLIVGVDAVTGVTAWKDKFYALTNDGAPKYQVFTIDPAHPERAAWNRIIPESDATIESLRLAGGHLIVQTLVNASSRLEVRALDGKLVRPIELPGLGSVVELVGEPTLDTAYFAFTSFTQPTQTFKTSIKSGKSELFAKVDLPIDTSRFEVQQVFYPSKDGTRVSMFIVAQKGLVKDGSHPTLLYGYGGFNQNMTPAFSSSIAVWLERGGVYAMPNLRGGGEYGEAWHRDGMLDKKQNVFDDFIAAAEYLIGEKYTSSDRLGIRGGSNGGLLVGAVMTQRPELFRAVICAVPLLDMVRYHLFGSGRTWIPEYGSAEEAADFKTLFAYSPYHHVTPGVRYPALLMLGADSDDRVDPMHARKFIALVQAANEGVEDAHPALFRLEKNAGHGGADLVKQNVQSYADQYAFLAWQLGVDLTRPVISPVVVPVGAP